MPSTVPTSAPPPPSTTPSCTLFVGRLSHFTSNDSFRLAMTKYGRVKSLHLVRHIVTGTSHGYALVEYETEKEKRRAYK
ncbi:hypothetical protein MLD38_018172 [Melastoma candidum]|uniref:Uncharacterized protein n=1 Tax=Melastoma candidum TaxID=119954 RepID=A0ACB9QT58_9MYRT|nr:hypothetical protein MLD38_018172 [Melastoma candidum]